MVRLHLDVLEPVFSHLHGSDLVAAALVSRDFLAGALPAIYAVIEYTTRHAKQAHALHSPFATLAAHQHLAVHVKRIAIHAAPIPNAIFIEHLARAIQIATNLGAFVCTVNIIAPLLHPLVEKYTLVHLRLAANAGARQLAVLRKISGLHSLAIDFPSWHVIDALPQWSASMQRTLAHLTLFMAQDLDANILNIVLPQLPRLRGLHVINCPRITHTVVLNALVHTPDLLELSFTLFPSQENTLPPLNFLIPPLTHLSLDVRASYPALLSFIARIVSRLSPREALAICGGWLGEIKSAAESDPPPRSNAPNTSQNPPGTNQNAPAPANNQNDDLFLLSPPQLHNPNHFSFSFGFLPGNHNGDDDNDHPHPPNPPIPDPIPNMLPLIASLPSTLAVLHLPLISPGALKQVVERCQDLQLLGLVLGPGFASKSGKPGRPNSHSPAGVRPEITLLASILARARALCELVLDTSNADIASAHPARDTHDAFRSPTLLTRAAVRTLMREVPLLRRVVGEGRVWESPTPTPTVPVPFPQCVAIDLTLSRARLGPGASSHHAYGPPGFGTPGGGYAQVETENDHWFWLTGSASRGKVYSRF